MNPYDKVHELVKAIKESNEVKEYLALKEELFKDELEADDDEFLNIELIEQEKLIQMIEDGTIIDGKTIMGILYFLRNVDKC